MKTIDWNAVYAIGALALTLGSMIAAVAWRMSRRFTRIDGKLDHFAWGQRSLTQNTRKLFRLHDRRLTLLEHSGPRPAPSGFAQSGDNPYCRFPIVSDLSRPETPTA